MWEIALLLIAVYLFIAAQPFLTRKRSSSKDGFLQEKCVQSDRWENGVRSKLPQDPRGTIEPLAEFDWETIEPIQYRPYKPQYHMTMGLANSNVSELILIDKDYLRRIHERKELIQDHLQTVIGVNEAAARDAVDELYTWLVTTYLPTRFSRMFTIATNPRSSRRELFNKATLEWYTLSSASAATETLQILGSIVEDDLMILLPDTDGNGFALKAFISCFPNSFSAPDILNMKLRDIHKPVPGYQEKLEFSMDRFFGKLEVGRFALRCNWSVTPYDKKFTPSGHRLTDGTREEAHAMQMDPNETFLRVERQVLHRLPQSQALVFL